MATGSNADFFSSFFKLVVWLCVSAFIASRSTMTCFILSFRNGECVVLPHMGVRDNACVACIYQARVVSSFFVFDMHIERVLDLILSIAIIQAVLTSRKIIISFMGCFPFSLSLYVSVPLYTYFGCSSFPGFHSRCLPVVHVI